MPFKYKKVLLVGATSGIGYAMAEKMLENGIKVIVVGRRKEKLDQLVKKHGNEKACPVVFDITQLNNIPQFAADVTKNHPDLDCVFLNSGIQRAFNFAKPETVNVETINEEITTNYLAYLHLTTAFLPHLQKQQNETSIVYVTSGLALIPSPRVLNYCASKAALHHFILTLRVQMEHGPGHVKIIELMPPAVQTELHDRKHQPDMKPGVVVGMPLDQFTDEAWQGLEAGDEQIFVGDMCKMAANTWEKQRQDTFKVVSKAMMAHAKSITVESD